MARRPPRARRPRTALAYRAAFEAMERRQVLSFSWLDAFTGATSPPWADWTSGMMNAQVQPPRVSPGSGPEIRSGTSDGGAIVATWFPTTTTTGSSSGWMSEGGPWR